VPTDFGCQTPGDDKGNGQVDEDEPPQGIFPASLSQVSQGQVDEKREGQQVDLAEYVRIIQGGFSLKQLVEKEIHALSASRHAGVLFAKVYPFCIKTVNLSDLPGEVRHGMMKSLVG